MSIPDLCELAMNGPKCRNCKHYRNVHHPKPGTSWFCTDHVETEEGMFIRCPCDGFTEQIIEERDVR